MNDYSPIVKFISQKCVGYNHDFSETYFEGIAQLKNGEIVKVYSVERRKRVNSSPDWKAGELPFIPDKQP